MAANLSELTKALVTELRGYLGELEAEGVSRAPGYEAELTRAIVELVKHENAFLSGASAKVNPLYERVCKKGGEFLIDGGWRP